MIKPGKMREKVIIQKRSVVIEKGIKKETWVDYYTNSAEILDLYGAEKYAAYQSKLENSIKFKMRSCPKLIELLGNAKEYRVIWNISNYNIIFADSLNGSKTEFILQIMKVS